MRFLESLECWSLISLYAGLAEAQENYGKIAARLPQALFAEEIAK